MLTSILPGEYPATELDHHLFSASLAELDSTDWVPGWRPFHTNLLVFSSQADFQLIN
jgi:hypothetical protein